MARDKKHLEKHIGEQKPLTQNTPVGDETVPSISPTDPNKPNSNPLKPIETQKGKDNNKQ